jgi:hypothetical protein
MAGKDTFLYFVFHPSDQFLESYAKEISDKSQWRHYLRDANGTLLDVHQLCRHQGWRIVTFGKTTGAAVDDVQKLPRLKSYSQKLPYSNLEFVVINCGVDKSDPEKLHRPAYHYEDGLKKLLHAYALREHGTYLALLDLGLLPYHFPKEIDGLWSESMLVNPKCAAALKALRLNTDLKVTFLERICHVDCHHPAGSQSVHTHPKQTSVEIRIQAILEATKTI